MKRASKRARLDADVIHDVRVAIRRLRQALDVFAPALDSAAAKKLDKKVRKLLKRAGEVRNLDIAIDMVKNARIAGARPLIDAIRKDRTKAAKDFAQELSKLCDSDFASKWPSKLAAPSPQTDPMEGYRQNLLAMTADLFDAGERAADPTSDSDTLHKFRIKTKKFRYTLELFEPLYGPSVKARMRVLRNLQQRLGDINDYAASRRILDDYRDGRSAVVDRALDRLKRMAGDETKEFRGYVHRSFGPKQKAIWIGDFTP
jgi:CHAD domain-containing protein